MTPAELQSRIYSLSQEMADECVRASKLFSSFNSTHEGYAVILEELDELWECIKRKGCNAQEMRKEAIQVGAMAIRFLFDLTFPEADKND